MKSQNKRKSMIDAPHGRYELRSAPLVDSHIIEQNGSPLNQNAPILV